MKRATLFLTLFLAFSVVACDNITGNNEKKDDQKEEEKKDDEKDDEEDDGPGDEKEIPDLSHLTKVSYVESDDIFLNPERGWYKWNGFYFNGNTPAALTKADVVNARNDGFAIMHCIYHLTDFRDKELSQSMLNVFAANMNAIREGGSKCTIRFSYTDWIDNNNKKIADAPVEMALKHIAKLKPLFQEHGDVILAVEAGFVGTWGEWWWTENYNFQPATTAQYEPRRKILDALLDAVPGDRMVCVRTARHKMLAYGLGYADSVTLKTAHNGSKMSRLAAHNDCFLASADDWGTYDGGNPDRKFWQHETKYVMMGGETCNQDLQYTNCPNAVEQLEKYHWTYLNRNYHEEVLQSWRNEKCYDEVQRRLGYRLVLKDGYFTRSPSASGEYEAALDIANVGFAAPVNPRDVELVFVAADDASKVYRVSMDEDPRFWFAGETHTVYAKFNLPQEMGPGKRYNVYLNLPDPKPRLANRAEYSIRLANKDVWNSATGFNKIHEFEL